MCETFSEYMFPASNIIGVFDTMLITLEREHGIHFKDPHYDIVRRFLNEIVEFKSEVEKCQEKRRLI